jgi:hypothetical protein
VKIRASVRAVSVVVLPAAALVVAVQPAQAQQAARQPAVAAAPCSPRLRSVALAPASVPGGVSSRVTVLLTCAGTRPQSVKLSGFAGTRVPQKLRVAAGKTEMSASIGTSTRRRAGRGWITAKLGTTSKRAQLTIGVTPKTCRSPTLSGLSLPNLAYVGDHVVMTVQLTCPSASAVRLSFASASTPASAPALRTAGTVTVGAYYRSAKFALTPKAYEPGQYKSDVAVRLGRKTLSRTITVDPGLSLFANSPDNCSPNDVNLNVLFTGNLPSGGVTVKLKSDNPAISVPASVAFTQPGSLGGGVSGVVVKSVSKNTKVTLSATLGTRTLTFSINLLAEWQTGDTITLSPEAGQGPIYGPSVSYEYAVQLSNPVSADGLTGTATTDDPSDIQNLDSEVLISPGCDNTIVSFQVPYESSPVHATVTVNLGGSAATIAVTIEPSLAAVNIPSTITGGQAATGTVMLAGAPDAPVTVYLQSTDGIATVPLSVTVPAGQASVTFPITTPTVTSDAQFSVNAWYSIGSLEEDPAYSNSAEVVP